MGGNELYLPNISAPHLIPFIGTTGSGRHQNVENLLVVTIDRESDIRCSTQDDSPDLICFSGEISRKVSTVGCAVAEIVPWRRR